VDLQDGSAGGRAGTTIGVVGASSAGPDEGSCDADAAGVRTSAPRRLSLGDLVEHFGERGQLGARAGGRRRAAAL